MTAPRPRILGPDPLVYPCEVSELIGVPAQRLSAMWRAGILPAPEPDGRLRLGAFLRAYIDHTVETARTEAAAKATREARARDAEHWLFGLE